MLYEVLGDIWVVQRNPYLQDDLLDNPKRRVQLVEALHHRLGEVQKRRTPETDRSAMPWWANCSRWRVRLCRPSTPLSWNRDLAAQGTARTGQTDRQGQHQVRWPLAGEPCDDATDWRVSIRLSCSTPDTEEEMARLVKGCIDLGLTIIPRGAARVIQGVRFADWKSVVINTRSWRPCRKSRW